MREKEIEKKLVERIKKEGGMCLKLTSPGNAGVPDRLCLLPRGRIVFVEMKAPGKKPRPLQVKQIQKIRKLGFRVEVIDSEEGIQKLMGGDA